MNPPILTAIPDCLKARRNWVVWRWPSKAPVCAIDGSPASSTDPETWASFDEAWALYERGGYSGVGYSFSEDDPFCGIDLDDCLAPGGIPYPKAWRMIQKLDSYTEVSPSGRGVKIICRAKKPGVLCKAPIEWEPGATGQIEIYDSARYFTITGDILSDTPFDVLDRQPNLVRLYQHLFPVTPTETPASEYLARIVKYLEKCPDSISGQNGHDKCLRAACECMRFGLSDADSFSIMRWWSDTKSGDEPWSDREIQHKLQSARLKVMAEGQIGVRLRESCDRRNNGHVNGHVNGHAKLEVAPTPAGASLDVSGRITSIAEGEYFAAPWCWHTLGRMSQALLPGAITLFCGLPGAGKSYWVLGAARGWLEMGIPFAVFMLEEDRTYHLQRCLAMFAGNSNLVDIEWVKSHRQIAEAETLKHAATLDAMGKAIHDAPEKRVTLMQLADWYEEMAKTVRVAVIDPVTAASTTDRRWVEDGAFMERVKTIARKTGTSLVLVTHPKLGNRKSITLDDLAGGADYPRFAQTVMSLEHLQDEQVVCATAFGQAVQDANRAVVLRKARNGSGGGSKIAFMFNPKTLCFEEKGMVIE